MLGEGTEKVKIKMNLSVLSFHVFPSQYSSDASEIPSSKKKLHYCFLFSHIDASIIILIGELLEQMNISQRKTMKTG
jgi:hypothetical protein